MNMELLHGFGVLKDDKIARKFSFTFTPTEPTLTLDLSETIFNPETDSVDLYYKGHRLFSPAHYSFISTFVIQFTFTLELDDIIYYDIWKNVSETPLNLFDGAMIMDGTVNLSKLSANTVSKINGIGDLSLLDTASKTDIVTAINEVKATGGIDLIGDLSLLNTTDKTDIVSAVNEVKESSQAIEAIGDLSLLNTVAKTDIVTAVNEVKATAGKLFAEDEVMTDPMLREADTLGGQLPGYYATASQLGAIDTKVGSLSSLTTTEKGNIVAAVNELNSRDVSVSNGISNLYINTVDLSMNLEVLKGSILTGVSANMVVETFRTSGDVTITHGEYDSVNKVVKFTEATKVSGFGFCYE